MAKTLRLDAYVRVSRVGGRSGDSFISPELQREEIERWATARRASIVWHEPELDVSGGSMDRPIFGEIMARVAAGESDGIVVAKLDRFARSLVGALATVRELEECGAVLVSVQDNIDLSTPTGRAFMRILLVFAELERERISENWANATASAISRGVHIANRAPFGFDRVDRRLVPNADADAVREVFRRRSQGAGLAELARLLDQLAPRPQGGVWTRPMVRRMIGMRVYRGEAHWGGLSNLEAHEAIVTLQQWQRAQAARAATPKQGKEPNLLGGIIRCAGCRYLMSPSNVGNGGSGAKITTYRCRARHAAGICPEPATITRARADRYVEEAFLAGIAGDRVTSVAAERADVAAATEALAELESELAVFAADARARSALGDRRYHDALTTRVAGVQSAQREVDRLLAEAPSAGQPGLIEQWSDFSTDERRRVLTNALDAVVIRRGPATVALGDRIKILWRGDGPDDLPRRGRDNGPVRPLAWEDRPLPPRMTIR
ncbi:MAG TPA: recombinase family protein [Solirubrobacteraceae bacterium]|nr:recombinase family protein [Solirubrobacteraceae bacterium]